MLLNFVGIYDRNHQNILFMEDPMKKLTLTIVLALAMTAAVFAAPLNVTKAVGSYTVAAVLAKNPPATGKNTVTFTIKDKSGAEVKNAKAAVFYSMPAMSGMPSMEYKSMAEYKGSSYAAVADFGMSGPWNVEVKFVTPQSKDVNSVKFSVDVR